ncbi:ribose-phosphate diphosphokinase [Candidatus Nomurabacteria bacterium]|nr:ribose-phosphate diphosphokinase [Candidatus Nomurabacteria bacterium]
MEGKNPYSLKLFSAGSETKQDFAEEISIWLKTPLEKTEEKFFSNGEFLYHQKGSVRDCDVYVIFQPRYGDKYKLAYDIAESETIVSALKQGEAHKITVVIPCLPYTRQDRPSNYREPVLVQMLPAKLQKLGADRIVTARLHNASSYNAYPGSIPITNINVDNLFIQFLEKKEFDLNKLKLVSPDLGAANSTRKIADGLGIPEQLVVMDKVRDTKSSNKSEVMNVIGEVEGFDCIIPDDIADTCGTALKSARALKERGASRVYFMAVHGVLSGSALQNLQNANFDGLWLGDTCDISLVKNFQNFEVISTSKLVSKVIDNLHNGESVNDLYKNGH